MLKLQISQAEKRLRDSKPDHEYLPITGLAEFCKLSAQLAFGDNSPVITNNLVRRIDYLKKLLVLA